ncbi:MAG: hypothetical protein U9N85_04410 [Bacteroidota bacterium]|nr:hypothetical protein [Bacteroidota bacterium]
MEKFINFREQRDFGELIGTPFHFLKQEFKPFSLILLKYAGPFLALFMLGLGLFAQDAFNKTQITYGSQMPNFIYLIAFVVLFMLGFIAVMLLTNSYITMYVKAGKGNFSENDVLTIAKENFWPVIGAGILIGLMVGVGFLLFYLPGIYLAIATSFAFISIVYEGKGVGGSISRSFAVIRGKWWITFALIFIFGLIVSFTSYIFFIPGYIIGIFAFANNSFDMGELLTVIVFAILYFTAYFYMTALQHLLIGFQYFNILTEKEGGTLEDEIDEIIQDEPAETVWNSDEPEEIPEPPTEKDAGDSLDANSDEDDYDRFSKKDEKNRFDTTGDNDPYKPIY